MVSWSPPTMERRPCGCWGYYRDGCCVDRPLPDAEPCPGPMESLIGLCVRPCMVWLIRSQRRSFELRKQAQRLRLPVLSWCESTYLLMDRQHRRLVISQFPLVVSDVSLAEKPVSSTKNGLGRLFPSSLYTGPYMIWVRANVSLGERCFDRIIVLDCRGITEWLPISQVTWFVKQDFVQIKIQP